MHFDGVASRLIWCCHLLQEIYYKSSYDFCDDIERHSVYRNVQFFYAETVRCVDCRHI